MARYGYGAPGSESAETSGDESQADDSDEDDDEDESGSGSSADQESVKQESADGETEDAGAVAAKRRKVEARSPSPVRTRGASRGRESQVIPVKTEVNLSPRLPSIPSGWLQPDSEPSEGYVSPVRSPKASPAPSVPKSRAKPSPEPQKQAKKEAIVVVPVAAAASPPKVTFLTMSPRLKTLPSTQVAPVAPSVTAPVPAAAEVETIPVVKLVADRPFLQRLEARKAELDRKLAEVMEAAAAQPQPEPEKPKCHWDFLLAEMVRRGALRCPWVSLPCCFPLAEVACARFHGRTQVEAQQAENSGYKRDCVRRVA
jgi:hypothetical protein